MNRRSRWSGRRWAAAAPTGLIIVLLATACGRAEGGVRIERAGVAELVDQLQCETTERFEADMSFYDEMRGANCFIGEETVLLRVYENDSSVRQVLPDLAPTISAENQIVVGTNWYATGSPRKLTELARLLGADAPSRRLTPDEPPPLGDRYEALGLCSSYVTGVVRAYLLEPDAVPELTRDSESAYPGLVEVAQEVSQRLRDEGVSETDFDSAVTFHATLVRAYCARIYGGK